MNVRGTFCLVLIVSALVLFAGCTGQQPAVTPTPSTTPQTVSTTTSPTIAEKPTVIVSPAADDTGPRKLLVNKAWKVRSWRTEPVMDTQNASVKSFLAGYQRRANDTFTWYDNGTLSYRYPNGTAYTTGTWNLAKNNTVIVEKYTMTDGFYPESENEILNLSESIFVIRYPVTVAGKEYFFIETQGL